MTAIVATKATDTREAWLIKATSKLTPHFTSKGYTLPPVRVSTGFTGSRSGNKAIGSCWAKEAATDGVHQLFISPVIADSVEALAVLTHELVHAAVGLKAGHKAPFKRCATAVGLEGKMTATTASKHLVETTLKPIISQIGDYPHAALTPSLSGKKKDGTRMLKAMCPSCGYTVRVTKTWAEIGMPTCCCGDDMVLV
jgi:hypothetical protein